MAQTGGTPPAAARSLSGFIENVGQWDTEARFVAVLGPMLVRVEPGALVLQHEVLERDRPRRGTVVRLELPAAFAGIEPRATGEPLPGLFHYLLGNDPSRWHTHVHHHAAVDFADPDGGSSLSVRVAGSGLDLSWDSITGSAPLHFRVDGSELLPVMAEQQALRMPTLAGELRFEVSAAARAVGGSLRVDSSQRITVNPPVGEATVEDAAHVHLVWATWLGGWLRDLPNAVVHDEAERVFLGGITYSNDFPTTVGSFDETWNGGSGSLPSDAFLSCIAEDGSALDFSTYIGGINGNEELTAIVLESSGSLLTAGRTSSSDYPTTPGALKEVTTQFTLEGFLTRISGDGSHLLASTYVGGTPGGDIINGMVKYCDGRIAVCGQTSSDAFPITPNAADPAPGSTGDWDGFVAILDEALSELLYGTYLGNNGNDIARGIALRPDGTLAVTGTGASEFPVTPGAFSTVAVQTGFALVLDPDSGQLVWSTKLPGCTPTKVAVHRDGSLVVAGSSSSSTSFPATPGAFQTVYGGATDGFVARVAADGASLHYATFLGGGSLEWLHDLAIDSAGRATVVGSTYSPNHPTTPGAWQESLTTINNDLYIARLDVDGSRLVYGSFWGGPSGESPDATALALTRTLGVTAAGFSSAEYPVTPDAYDPIGGEKLGFKAVVSRLTLMPAGAGRYGEPSAQPASVFPPRPVIGVTAMPQLGTSFGVTCVSVPEGVPSALLAVSLAQLPSALGVKGIGLWVDPTALLALLAVPTNADGYAVLEFRLPSDAVLAGIESFWQFLGPLPASERWWASDALRVVLQP